MNRINCEQTFIVLLAFTAVVNLECAFFLSREFVCELSCRIGVVNYLTLAITNLQYKFLQRVQISLTLNLN
jgi:hypothetical protein